MRGIVIAAAAGLWLSACASSGVKVSQEQVSKFEKGKTTYSQVVAALGAPTTNIFTGDGKRMVMYTFAASSVRPETFIPLVGGLVGGADTKMSNATFTFDQNGVLLDANTADSAIGTGMGFAAGNAAVQRTEQPREAK